MLLKAVRLPKLARYACCSPASAPRIVTRRLVTLAIESSCDDTSVAVLEKNEESQALEIHFHEKVTANSLFYQGIHPLVAQQSHEENLAQLVATAIHKIPSPGSSINSIGIHNNGSAISYLNGSQAKRPNFVTVTRGPGMRSSLNAGLNTAKGLAVAWQVPLVGVNHMQAHALTPRLVSALSPAASGTAASGTTEPKDSVLPQMAKPASLDPRFPFMSLLVSGGHTMLIRSESLCEHPTLATTSDIAIGDAIDKMARDILPPAVLATAATTMYGPVLEAFAFPCVDDATPPMYRYEPPPTRKLQTRVSQWGWGFTPMFATSKGGAKVDSMEFSFSGICAGVKREVERAEAAREMALEERREMAREAMCVAFEHLASRVVLGLEGSEKRASLGGAEGIDTLVVSGGVAANGYLRHILRSFLDARGFEKIRLIFPPLELCTDNAVMIGWTGIEMFEAGWTSELSCQSLRKWSLDPAAEDGGIFGVSGWKKLNATL